MLRYKFSVFFAILLGFMVLLMIGPRLPDDRAEEHCVYNIDFPGPFGFSLSCDSGLFHQLAHNPKELLDENNVRQERPGFIFLAAGLALFFKAIFPLPYKEFVGLNMLYLPYYAAYITINILILMLSFWFYVKITRLDRSFAVFAVGCLLIFNDVVKAFIWSPHTQILNILVPLFCLWCFIEVTEHRLFERPIIFAISILVGLGVTVYSSFALYLPAIFLPALVIAWRTPSRLIALGRFAIRAGIIFGLVALPAWLWYLYVESQTGSFYSHSIEQYHHLVWIVEAGRLGLSVLISQLSQNFWNLLVFAAEQAWIIVLVLIPFITVHSINNSRLRELLSIQLLGSVFIAGMFLAFFTLVGLVVSRIAYTAIPPFVALAGYIIHRLDDSGVIKERNSHILVPLTVFTILGYGIFELLKDGPYS
ncbi:MAG: hypothetical protein ABFS56_34860 [Pseudomonadota bacterium]